MTKKSSVPVKSGVTDLRRGAEEKRSLGDRIRAFRKHLGLKQKEFGELIGGVALPTVSHWENGRPPHHRHYARMLELAKEHGGLRMLVGTDERELMLARFRMEEPRVGALMFLDFAVDNPGDFGAVLADLCGLGVTLISFATVGEDPDAPKTDALALVFSPDFPTMDAVKKYLKASERIQDPHVSFNSKGIKTSNEPRSR